ncbi:TVP38/TMEM64 family protein [Clostridium tyrobutyricum]|uniref:TVP38/TMEM64 family protein n=1 Tax=Clostridium tyrobutyricum TaxID=1519 RepID=UPI001C3920E8|nr:TVP38/TMEM64 family protein [Clostridium tyrobutyricum]MBV4419926.1 TVP38/TMEM64 family protein [Clostridium tyrobutyricum]
MSIFKAKKILFKNIKRFRNYIILAILIAIFILLGYEYYFKYMKIINNPKVLKDIILSYGRYGVLAFFTLEILQVVVFFIPGEFVQISAGYIYGPFWGIILSIVGITLGSVIAYTVSKIYGRPFIERITSKNKLKFFTKILNSRRVNLLVFLLYLIPGIPKDILSYICGVSKMNLREFFIYSTLGRLPGIIISSYFGSKLYSGNKFVIVIISVSMVLLFLIGFLKGKKALLRISKCGSSTQK